MIDENDELRMKKAIEYFDDLNNSGNSLSKDPLDVKFKNSFLKDVFNKQRKSLEIIDEEMADLKINQQTH